jgi:hypothetical protein
LSLDHAAIRGDHLTDLDWMATAMANCNYTDEAAAYELALKLSHMGYGSQGECLKAAAVIVKNAKTPREEPTTCGTHSAGTTPPGQSTTPEPRGTNEMNPMSLTLTAVMEMERNLDNEVDQPNAGRRAVMADSLRGGMGYFE